MVNAATIFQRTDTGRNEIKTKNHGLTQSERRVLITIDGTTSYGALPLKLASLQSGRIDRALHKLLVLELIAEVLLPVPGQGAETFDSEVVDRFLHQDAYDPVTIISFDPDQEFDPITLPAPSTPNDENKNASSQQLDLNNWLAHANSIPVVVPPAATSNEPVALIIPSAKIGAGVDFYLPLEQQADSTWDSALSGLPDVVPVIPNESGQSPLPGIQTADSTRWEFWVIGAGILLIVTSVVMRYFR